MPFKKKFCLMHANCQGEPLSELLLLSEPFAAQWEIRHYLNYTKEHVPREALDNCDLFLYQHLEEKWGDLASSAMLARLGPKAASFCLPNMFFKGCWPFWTTDSPMDFGDTMLDRLLTSGVGKPEIMKVYLRGDITKFVDLAALLAETLSLEEKKEKFCDVATVPIIHEYWQREMLFYTCNHPAKRLLAHVANAVLTHLGYPALPESRLRDYQPEYAEFELPFHPGVARFHNLGYAGEGYEFLVFGRRMCFGRYISRYIECRRQGMEDSFLPFLQLV